MKKSYLFVSLMSFLTANVSAAKIINWSRTSESVKIQFHDGTMMLTPQKDNAMRVRFYRGNVNELPEYVYVSQSDEVSLHVTDKTSYLEVALPEIIACVDKENGYIVFKEKTGKVILSEKPDGRLIYSTDLGEEKTYFIEQKFESPQDEYLFGTGQFQDGYLNIRGLSRRLAQQNTQISVPFILSSKGYGLLWHNYGLTYFNPADSKVTLKRNDGETDTQVVNVTSTEGTKKEIRNLNLFTGSFEVPHSGNYAILLDVGSRMARKHNIKIDGRQVTEVNNIWLPSTTSLILNLEAGRHSVVVESEKNDKPELFFKAVEDETVFRSPVSDCLDYTVFSGYGDEVISSYRSLSGPAPMMPKWALGYIHCRERFKSQDELLGVAEEFRKRELPVDLIVQDWQYWGKYGWNAMQFDEKDYPNPAKMVSDLHDMDMRLMLSVWSKIDNNSTLGKEFQKKKYYIDNTTWVDFFNPDAAAFYWSNFSNNLLSKGIDAWWQDATEPENDDLQGRMVNGNTLNGNRVRNIYPLMVCKTVYEGCRTDQPEKRTMILTRSGFSGLQRYAAATWSGDVGNDWETLRRQIAAGLNYMAAGLPWWTYDAGGFFRPGNGQYTSKDYQERFLRWFQAATFLPLQRVHGYQTDTEFWNYGKDVTAIARQYLDFRYRMLPYIYSEAAAVTFRGSTLMRPFVMDFADDSKALECRHSYMFGPSLLVAPVVYPGLKEASVYLPGNGTGWYDFWSGKKFNGGNTVSIPVSLEKIPLFVKEGSIIPLGEPKQHTGEKKDDVWEIRIYPGKNARYTVYEDEGTNYNYEKGQYSTFDLIWDDNSQTLTLSDRKGSFTNMVEQRKLRIVKVSSRKGTGMKVSGRADKTITYKGNQMVVSLGNS